MRLYGEALQPRRGGSRQGKRAGFPAAGSKSAAHSDAAGIAGPSGR